MNPITKKMKRYINMPLKKALPLVLLSVVLLISIAGCTTPSNTSPSPPANVAPPQEQLQKASATATATPSATPAAATVKPESPTKGPTAAPTSTPQANGPFIYSSASSSKVYHYPWCSYVAQMKEANRGTFSSSAQAQAAGYHPCSRCNPP